MGCISDGMLRAQLDGELGESERMAVKEHCDSCADCRRRAEAMARNREQVRGALSNLAPLEDEAPSDARIALARFQARHPAFEHQKPATLLVRRLAPAWATLGVMGLIAIVLAFAPARSWAQRLLGLLRVQRIQVVPLDFVALNNPNNRALMGKTMGQLLSDNVVFTLKPGEPQSVATQEEATRIGGFNVRLLRKREDVPQLKVLPEQAFHMTLDRDRLQAILDDVGRSDLQLPYAVDGATISVRVPKVVFAQYGHCGRRAGESGDEQAPAGEPAEASDCAMLIQSLSPSVTVPPELNMVELAEVGFQLGGMSPEAAHQLSRSIDWTTTLVLGIPVGTSSRAVEVDGVQGTLVQLRMRGDRFRRSQSLLWVKDGVIHALFASGEEAAVLTLAESLN